MICVRIVVHCKDLSKDDITYLKTLKIGTARIRVTTDGSLTTLIANGIYDDIVQIIVAVSILKNFEVHLS